MKKKDKFMKNHIGVRNLIIAALLIVPMFALAEAPTYSVSVRIVENDLERSTPRILVSEGSEVSIGTSGENPLTIGMVVNGHGEEEVHVLAEVLTAENHISPELLMRVGQWASVSVGELELHLLVEHPAAGR